MSVCVCVLVLLGVKVCLSWLLEGVILRATPQARNKFCNPPNHTPSACVFCRFHYLTKRYSSSRAPNPAHKPHKTLSLTAPPWRRAARRARRTRVRRDRRTQAPGPQATRRHRRWRQQWTRHCRRGVEAQGRTGRPQARRWGGEGRWQHPAARQQTRFSVQTQRPLVPPPAMAQRQTQNAQLSAKLRVRRPGAQWRAPAATRRAARQRRPSRRQKAPLRRHRQ